MSLDDTMTMGRDPNTRRHILQTADNAVNGERNSSYGDPTQDFARTARYWNEHICSVYERRIAPIIAKHPEQADALHGFLDFLVDMISSEDVAAMMMLLKISRISWSPSKEDHWVDVAGYAACGAQCAERNHGGLK